MKKHILSLALFVSLAFSAKAQLEFAPIGAEWVYNVSVDADQIGFNPLAGWVSYKCTGDTTVGNQVFRKIGELLFFQQGSKVYLWRNEVTYLIYDFDLAIGDTAELSIPICLFPDANFNAEIQMRKFVVQTITTITVNGLPLKKFRFSEIHENNPSSAIAYEYIEKIGNPQWFVGECFIPTTHLFPWLRCYKDNVLDYKSEQFLAYNISDCYYIPPSAVSHAADLNIRIAPNPVTDELTIDLADNSIEYLSISNVSGQLVFEQPAVQSGILQIATNDWPHGIYFCSAKIGAKQLVWKIIK